MISWHVRNLLLGQCLSWLIVVASNTWGLGHGHSVYGSILEVSNGSCQISWLGPLVDGWGSMLKQHVLRDLMPQVPPWPAFFELIDDFIVIRVDIQARRRDECSPGARVLKHGKYFCPRGDMVDNPAVNILGAFGRIGGFTRSWMDPFISSPLCKSIKWRD